MDLYNTAIPPTQYVSNRDSHNTSSTKPQFSEYDTTILTYLMGTRKTPEVAAVLRYIIVIPRHSDKVPSQPDSLYENIS